MECKKCHKCNKNVYIKIIYIKKCKLIYTMDLNDYKYKSICKVCFSDPSKYKDIMLLIDITNFNNSLFKNIIIYATEKNIYIDKIEWENIILNKNNKQLERKNFLTIKIKEYKLKYIDPICAAYIKFGKPPLDEVVEQLIAEQNDFNDRMFELITFLNKNNIEYSENIPAYKKYIQCGGNLNKVLEESKIELFLVNQTNYLCLLKQFDSNTAREVAIYKYIQDGGKDDIAKKYLNDKISVKFD